MPEGEPMNWNAAFTRLFKKGFNVIKRKLWARRPFPSFVNCRDLSLAFAQIYHTLSFFLFFTSFTEHKIDTK